MNVYFNGEECFDIDKHEVLEALEMSEEMYDRHIHEMMVADVFDRLDEEGITLEVTMESDWDNGAPSARSIEVVEHDYSDQTCYHWHCREDVSFYDSWSCERVS